MLLAPFVAFFVPTAVRVAPLFGQAPAVVDRILGKPTRRFATTLEEIPKLETTGARGSATYLNGRVYRIGIDFPLSPDITWEDAMKACGYPHPILLNAEEPMTYSGNTVQTWVIGGGSLPDGYTATFTRSRTGAKNFQQALWIDAPPSVALAPSPGERKAILDAIRPGFVKAYRGQALKFIVGSLATARGWAVAEVEPIAVSGDRLDLGRSVFAGQESRVSNSRLSYALLRKTGTNWKVVEAALYDSASPRGWAAKHGAPKILFPKDM